MLELLDVLKLTKPHIDNYNTHANRLVYFLKRFGCRLVYDGAKDLQDHFIDQTVYGVSLLFEKNNKRVRNIFPVMIRSDLDLAIRRGTFDFSSGIPASDRKVRFETIDHIMSHFVINGYSSQLPYLFTNDPTNVHVTKKRQVICYSYDSNDRGKKCTYHPSGGDRSMSVTHNDGSVTDFDPLTFFDHVIPYTARGQEAYMSHLYRENQFDIDHLSNKIVVSPGHLFVKLIVKYLYGPLRESNWSAIKSKANIVIKSIESGCLLHVLSRKTLYFKERGKTGKMVAVPNSSDHREIGSDGQVFMEKSTGCYREVNSQTFPLNPFLSYIIVRQISNKVKSSCAFHPSYVGFICILGCFETKNVGRTQMLCQETFVSDECDLDPVYHARGSRLFDLLGLEQSEREIHKFYVVVNEACIDVTRACFARIDLGKLKKELGRVECFHAAADTIHVRYKIGLVFKQLVPGLWVTARDEMYWAQRLWGIQSKSMLVDRMGYDYITAYLPCYLNPYFKHNAFLKNILANNATKNSILAWKKDVARFFLDTVSAYFEPVLSYHKPVLEPVEDGISEHFVMYVPKIVVAYYSYKGCNQEDCIVVRDGLNCFDSFRFYTIRFKVDGGPFAFYPAKGEERNDCFLGTIVSCRGSSPPLSVEPQSIHVNIRPQGRMINLFFDKTTPFRVSYYYKTRDKLVVCVEQFHKTDTGDKLCSFHGQKGVIRLEKDMPLLDEKVVPDAIVNPYALFRMTPGQIIEGISNGHGKDAKTIRHGGKLLPSGSSTFYAETSYFPIAFFSSEHIYAPTHCKEDKVLGQPVKGRSRGGGMRIGNMEYLNGLRGNGIAACMEEKFYEHGDRKKTVVPKSVNLVKQDAMFFKSLIDFETEPLVEVISK